MKHDHGIIASKVPGRTDKINIEVPENSFVIPADIVSALGEGNSAAGDDKLQQFFGPSEKFSGKRTPIVAAGGEWLVNPNNLVKKYGDLDHGLKVMHHFTEHTRKETVKTLKGLNSPKK